MKDKGMKILQKIKSVQLEKLILRLITAYCFSSAGLLIWRYLADGTGFLSLQFVQTGSLPLQGLIILAVFSLLSVFELYVKEPFFAKLLLYCGVLCYFSLLCLFGFNVWFFLFLCIFSAVCAYYCFNKTPPLRLRRNVSAAVLLTVAAGIVCLFVATEGCLRQVLLRSDAFDAGLYRQMFYQMAQVGKPLTSLAGNGLTSRFDADPAPVLYLLLPLYLLFRSLSPYIILQTVALASGVVPLYLVCKKYGLRIRYALTVCGLYLVNPAIWTGAFYDFHEQSLLVPCLLWIFYFVEKDKRIGAAVFSLLTLSVGKEGVIALLVVGLYFLFSKKKKKIGVALILASLIAVVVYQLISSNFSLFGDCVFTADEFSKLLIADPGYLLKTIFSEHKLSFLVLMLLPLGGLPLMTKKYASLLLLLPTLFALFSVNSYDASIYYQHAFMPATLLFCLFASNLHEVKFDFRKIALGFCLLASVTSICGTVVSRTGFISDYAKGKQVRDEIVDRLEVIPSEATVAASSGLTSLLAERDMLYSYFPQTDDNGNLVDYFQFDDCEYIALALYDSDRDANLQCMQMLIESGKYISVVYREDVVVVLNAVSSAVSSSGESD